MSDKLFTLAVVCFCFLPAAGPDTRPAREVAAAVNQAVELGNLGDYAGAEILLRNRLETVVSVRGDRNPEAAELMLSLAETLAMLGRHVESTRLYRRAASVAEEVYGPQNIRTAAALSGLAHTLRRIDRKSEAEALYRRSIYIVEHNRAAPHPVSAHARCRLGLCLSERRKYKEGQEEIERGIDEAAELFGPDSYQVAIERRHLGMALINQKQWGEAYTVFGEALGVALHLFVQALRGDPVYRREILVENDLVASHRADDLLRGNGSHDGRQGPRYARLAALLPSHAVSPGYPRHAIGDHAL